MTKKPLIPLIKMIEATKLHPRTGMPLGVPPVTIPYGGLVQSVGPDRDNEKFTYLGELYACKRDAFQSATGADKAAAEPAQAPPAASAPARAVEETVVAGPRLAWEQLNSGDYSVRRAAVPGGWLVAVNSGVTFVPDAKHSWDGASVG